MEIGYLYRWSFDEVFLVNIAVCLAYIWVAGWGGGWEWRAYHGLTTDANRLGHRCVKAERGRYFVDKSTGCPGSGGQVNLVFHCRTARARGRAIVPSACMDGRMPRGGHKPPEDDVIRAIFPIVSTWSRTLLGVETGYL
jgi:hypothetical protein